MSANHHGEQWIEKADPRRSSQRSELGRTKEEGTLWLDISHNNKELLHGLVVPKVRKKSERTGPKKSDLFL